MDLSSDLVVTRSHDFASFHQIWHFGLLVAEYTGVKVWCGSRFMFDFKENWYQIMPPVMTAREIHFQVKKNMHCLVVIRKLLAKFYVLAIFVHLAFIVQCSPSHV